MSIGEPGLRTSLNLSLTALKPVVRSIRWASCTLSELTTPPNAFATSVSTISNSARGNLAASAPFSSLPFLSLNLARSEISGGKPEEPTIFVRQVLTYS